MMSAVMAKAAGRADGKRVERAGQGETGRLEKALRRRSSSSIRRGAELAGAEDTVLKALEGHLDRHVFLRGNVLTSTGSGARRRGRPRGRPRASELIAQGHEISPGTIDAVTSALDQQESPHDPRRRRVDAPLDARRAQDRQPEALRRLDPQQHDHIRDRPGRHRQDLPRDGDGDRRAVTARRQSPHPHPAGRRGGRAARASCPAR